MKKLNEKQKKQRSNLKTDIYQRELQDTVGSTRHHKLKREMLGHISDPNISVKDFLEKMKRIV